MDRNENVQSDEIDIVDYLRVLAKRKKMIALLVVIITVTTVVVALMTPKYYRAQAVIMPISGGGGGGLSAVLGQFGGLASLAGISGGEGTVSHQFMALLSTRTLAENIINKYNLMEVIFEEGQKVKAKDAGKMPSMEVAVSSLLGSVKFNNDQKTGKIIISAEFKDPKLAAELANGYVEGLGKILNDNSLTVAKRNRVFIEQQLQQNKKELLESGKELNEFYRGGRVSNIESKIDIDVTTNKGILPDRLENNLEDLNAKKKEVESVMVVKDIPQQVYLQYLTLRKNILTQMNSLLTQQYEMAKIEEAKDDFSFQVLDFARVPEKRSRPKRTQMVLVAFTSSLFLGSFAAFFIEYLKKLRQRVKTSTGVL